MKRLALLLLLAWLALHLADARDQLGVLSGSSGVDALGLLLALAYLLAWFGVVLLAPVLIIGHLLRVAPRPRGIMDAWTRRCRSSKAP
jgi:hypothetical protein